MSIEEFVSQFDDFNSRNHPDRIKAFGWFLHVYKDLPRFRTSDIRQCYNDCHLDLPANLNRFLDSLTEKKPPELLKDKQGYRLSASIRTVYDKSYAKTEAAVIVEKLLTDLVGKVADEAERLFLTEALVCYKHRAFRAAIVMTWNLAYDHLLRWIITDPSRHIEFNSGIQKRYPKKVGIVVNTRDEFEQLKESEVIEVAVHVTGFSSNLKKLLNEKLNRRNIAAHPSLLEITRTQADDTITDLVNNVVLKLV